MIKPADVPARHIPVDKLMTPQPRNSFIHSTRHNENKRDECWPRGIVSFHLFCTGVVEMITQGNNATMRLELSMRCNGQIIAQPCPAVNEFPPPSSPTPPTPTHCFNSCNSPDTASSLHVPSQRPCKLVRYQNPDMLSWLSPRLFLTPTRGRLFFGF